MRTNEVTQLIVNHLKTIYREPFFIFEVFPNVGVFYIRKAGDISDIKVEINYLFLGIFYAKFDDMENKRNKMYFYINKNNNVKLLMY